MGATGPTGPTGPVSTVPGPTGPGFTSITNNNTSGAILKYADANSAYYDTSVYIDSSHVGYASDWVATSDKRLKENILSIENALDTVLSTKGVYFNFINDIDKKQKIGVLAQDIEAVIPQVVFTNEQGSKSVSYGNLTAMLIEAIKELNTKVDKLQNEVNVLKNK